MTASSQNGLYMKALVRVGPDLVILRDTLQFLRTVILCPHKICYYIVSIDIQASRKN